jgi:hypothetical protein
VLPDRIEYIRVAWRHPCLGSFVQDNEGSSVLHTQVTDIRQHVPKALYLRNTAVRSDKLSHPHHTGFVS